MNTYELLQRIDLFEEKIKENGQFIRAISQLLDTPIRNDLIGQLIDSRPDDPLYIALHNQAMDAMNSFIAKLRTVRPRAMFILLQTFEDDLNYIQDNFSTPEVSFIRYLLSQLDSFGKAYENFIDQPSSSNALILMLSTRRIDDSIASTRMMLSNLRKNLDPHEIVSDEFQVVSIFLPSIIEYNDLLIKLTAIERIYSELCQLIKVSMAEYPLRIIKVESGSLWVKVFGESRVMALFTSLLQSAAAYIYRNYTEEGRISSIPKQIQSIEAILGLTDKLKEQGVDTSQIKENVQKAAVTISQQLNELLQGQSGITVNNESIPAQKTISKKVLTGREVQLLSDGSEQDDSQIKPRDEGQETE
jgi:hypothetical protein